MGSFNEFIHMGGYASYVWSSYGIVLLAFGLSIILPLREKRQLEKRIRRIIQNEQSSSSE